MSIRSLITLSATYDKFCSASKGLIRRGVYLMVDDSKCDMAYDKFCTARKELGILLLILFA